MSLTVCPLASGSSGNAIYIGDTQNKILIDCGLSGKKTEELLRSRGTSCAELDGVILTHEHSDHIRGAGVLARRWKLPLFTRPGTWGAGGQILDSIPSKQQKLLLSGLTFGKIEIDYFPLSHDAMEPVGLVIRWGKRQISLVTDLGEITPEVEEKIHGSDIFIVEANHDPDMLASGPYPYFLKKRVSGPQGHLSNDDCGLLLSRALNEKPARVYLAHLSEENNDPQVARLTVENFLRSRGRDSGLEIEIAKRYCASLPIKLL